MKLVCNWISETTLSVILRHYCRDWDKSIICLRHTFKQVDQLWGKCQNWVEPGRQIYWKGGTSVCELISKCLENIDNVSFNIDKTVFSCRLPVLSNMTWQQSLINKVSQLCLWSVLQQFVLSPKIDPKSLFRVYVNRVKIQLCFLVALTSVLESRFWVFLIKVNLY